MSSAQTAGSDTPSGYTSSGHTRQRTYDSPGGHNTQAGLVAELPPNLKLRPLSNGRRELCAVNWGRLRSPRACPNRVCLQWHQPATVFPKRPLGEVEIKNVYQYNLSRSENPLHGHAGANRDRHEWDSTSSLPALDAQDTRPQVI